MTRSNLSRRVERTEEDLAAISDTVLEIKATVDQHSDVLAAHGRELRAIREVQGHQGKMLASQGKTLASHSEMLASQGEMLASQGEMLASQGEMLASQGEMLAQHGEMLAEILCRLDAR